MSDKKHYEAIKDVHVNLDNRNHAIDEYGYGPLNPNESNDKFWNEKAKLWKTSVEEAKKSRCHNCAAFNQTPKIIKAMGDALGPVGDKIVEKANLGYCEFFYFKCAGERTCDAWITNGPLKEFVNKDAENRGVLSNDPIERLITVNQNLSATKDRMRDTIQSGAEQQARRKAMETGYDKGEVSQSELEAEYKNPTISRSVPPAMQRQLRSATPQGTEERISAAKTVPGRSPSITHQFAAGVASPGVKQTIDHFRSATELSAAKFGSEAAKELAAWGARTVARRNARMIPEDAPTVNAGSGNIDSIGVGAAGEPGVSPRVQRKIQNKNAAEADARNPVLGLFRRKTPMQTEETQGVSVKSFVVEKGKFAGHDTFIVPSDVFHIARMEKKKGKHWRTYIGQGVHAEAIRQHAKANYGKPIILQDEKTGALCYASYGNRKQSLDEAPLLDYIGKKQKFNRETGRKLSNPGERVARIDRNHDLHHLKYPDGSSSYIARNRKTGVAHMTIFGQRNRAGSFEINATDSTGQGPKAHKVYRKILQSGHATTLVGASHSEGGQKIWQKLSSEPNVSVHGWYRNKPVNLDPKDPEETHMSAREMVMNLDKGDRKTYGTKLVASYVKRKTAK